MATSSVALAVALSILLAATGTVLLGPPMQEWREGAAHVHEQFAQLEGSMLSLGEDTNRLKTTAKVFLQSCQDLQVSAVARTELIANSATQSLSEQAKERVELHAAVTKEALEFHAKQKQRIHETRERLLSMNLTLPVQVLIKPMPTFSNGVEGELRDRTSHERSIVNELSAPLKRDFTPKTLDQVASAMEEIAFFAEKSMQQDGNDGSYQRMSVQSIGIQTVAQASETSPESGVRPSSSSSSSSSSSAFVFYALVACISIGYLWNAVTDTRKELKQDDRAWSPVPKLCHHLKEFLISVVVVDDLRGLNGGAKDGDGSANALQEGV